MDILVVGSVGLDTIETPSGKVDDVLGGSAVHFGVSASHFSKVGLVGIVGEDFPQEHKQSLIGRDINLAGLEVVPGETFKWSGKYEGDCNIAYTLSTELNVFADFKPKIPGGWRDVPVVFLANIDPDLQLHVLEQVASPRLVVSDTMNFWIQGKLDSLKEVIARSTIFLANDQEARDITGCWNLARATRKLIDMGPQVVVVKKGEHGALLASRDRFFVAPGFPVHQIADPTGAGDSFAGGFVGYLAYSGSLDWQELKNAVVFGSIMGSFNVEDFSADRLLGVTREELMVRYQAFHDLVAFDANP